MLYLQIAAAVVSLLLGLAQMTKESAPLVQKVQENQRQAEIIRQQQQAQMKAQQIASMNINWQCRGNDGTWRYYSDQSGRYWCRVNIQGIQEYSESPEIRTQIAVNPTLIK